jgi:hypothetical protein
LEFFVITGSDYPAVGSLAKNLGFPHVTEFYVAPMTHQNQKGLGMKVIFDGSPTNGTFLSINVIQPEVKKQDIVIVPLV